MSYPPLITQSHALFLDFDGTLTALIHDAKKAALLPDIAEMLPHLHTQLNGALAIISGRDARNLSARIPHSLMRIGCHGLEICPAGEAPAKATPGPLWLRSSLEDIISPHQGAFVEDKGPVCAVHYREAPHAGAEIEAAMLALVAPYPDYSVMHGKFVLEARPLAANKGYALKHVMREAPFEGRTPIMVGDDTTDEDAFIVAQGLGGIAIKVGTGESHAKHRLESPQQVAAWLKNAL